MEITKFIYDINNEEPWRSEYIVGILKIFYNKIDKIIFKYLFLEKFMFLRFEEEEI